MSSTSSVPSAQTKLANLNADARYEILGQTSPSEIPNFEAMHTQTVNGRTFVDAEACIGEMADWLDNRINAGERRSPYNNDDYLSISTRTNIPHYAYRDSPVLPRPDTMDIHGANCIRVQLKGTVKPNTRYDDPEPKTEAYQQLWNFVSIFAHATDAEVKTQYSQSPRDDFNVYLFYDF